MNVKKMRSSFFIKQRKINKKENYAKHNKKKKVGVAGLQPTLISLDYSKL